MENHSSCESPPVRASDDTSNDTLCDSPLLDLQTPDPYTHQLFKLPRNASILLGCPDSQRSVKPARKLKPERKIPERKIQRVLHMPFNASVLVQACVTTARYREPVAVHTSEDYTSNGTLCDSPVLDLRTLHTPDGTSNDALCAPPPTPFVTARSWICEPWPDPYTRQTEPGLGSANPGPYTHQTTPPTTPCVTDPPQRIHTILRTLTPQLEVRIPIANAIWGTTNFGWKW